ncbi:YesL family protein [Cytobacillus gottheilii]|uniref:YesL family protein n=1 Tax=Cytobacillus gottheilii TaxID=859144 RepID=UPI0009BA0027|nr:YesL family protein [Cytobacillus gottheilii]
MNKTATRAYAATEWITKFAYVNLLWIGFSLAGLVVFGIFPATVSMFTVVRKWIMGDADIPIFQTFWNTYKSEFMKSNSLGAITIFVLGLIILNLVIIQNAGSGFFGIIQVPVYMFMFVAGITIFYMFPVYVHFELTLVQIIKNSFLMMLLHPIENLVMISGVAAVALVVKFIPGLGFFFGGSMTAAILMAACYLVFKKVKKKQMI